jgi:hypothetical protein
MSPAQEIADVGNEVLALEVDRDGRLKNTITLTKKKDFGRSRHAC